MCLMGLVSACGNQADGGSAPSATAIVVGAQLESTPAEASEALVLWTVSSGQPDYAYIWGRADVVGKSFKGSLERVSGAAERHAIIYVDRDRANAYIDAMSATATPHFDFPNWT
jgi:hypothetical protein